MNIKLSITQILGRLGRGIQHSLSQVDRRFRWAKYVLVAIFASSSLFFGEYTVIDYFKLQRRGQVLQGEIDKLTPKLQEDSIRLRELRHLGRGTEVIAREKYLMKSPSEQIFLITQDSTNNK